MDRQGLVFLARLAEQAERYDEIVGSVTVLANDATEDLTEEERNLFPVAFKNATGSRRASWRILSALQKSRAKSLADFPELTTALSLTTSCSCARQNRQGVLPQDEGRLRSLHGRAPTHKCIVAEALRDYACAHEAALLEIAPTHYLRLGLALNFSVFHYDIIGDIPAACAMAKQAFDDALAELDALDDDDAFRDSTLVMQLLRQNITLWTTTDEDEDEGGEDVVSIPDEA